jgi:hypothetical protein
MKRIKIFDKSTPTAFSGKKEEHLDEKINEWAKTKGYDILLVSCAVTDIATNIYQMITVLYDDHNDVLNEDHKVDKNSLTKN